MSATRMLVVHGGAPTAVLNASLFGVLSEAAERGIEVLGAHGGTGGLRRGDVIPLRLSDVALAQLPFTPGSLIGTSRDHLDDDDYVLLADQCAAMGIDWVAFTGGDGTFGTCQEFYRVAQDRGVELGVTAIPKTIDNDLLGTDHAPGFASAARYLAATTAEIVADVRSLPIHVSIIETMGRNAGWLTAASAYARTVGAGPDLIYVPEIPFSQDDFLSKVEAVYRDQGYAVVVVSEGLRDSRGVPVVPPLLRVGRSEYFGDVGAWAAELVLRELGIKARSEKPGIAGRASIAWQSEIDREEAIAVGRAAVEFAARGESGYLVSLDRQSDSPYRCVPVGVPLDELQSGERTLPEHFLTPDGVSDTYLEWLAPLVGPLPWFTQLGEIA